MNSGIEGSTGDATCRYVSTGTEAMGTPSFQNSTSAMPPSVAKIGSPSKAAARITPMRGHTSPPPAGPASSSASGTSSPAAASVRRVMRGEAFQTARSAIARNPTGMIASATHLPIPSARIVPPSRSARTNCRLAQASARATAAATVEVNTRTRGSQRAGSSVLADSASSRSDRAATVEPTNATHSVRCCTKTADPGIEGSRNCRAISSSTGSSDMAESSATASASSAAASFAASVFTWPPRLRYSSRRRRTSSNKSAGTMRPRIFGYTPSACLRQSATVAASACTTVSLRFSMATTASSPIFRMPPRSSCPASCAALSICARSAGASFSQVALVTTVAPTSGAHLTSHMFRARPKDWFRSAYSGVVGTASISPVCSPLRMSVAASGTGRKPFACHSSSASLSPAQVNSFICLKSSGLAAGLRVKKYTQPASPQFSTRNPRASIIFSRRGAIRSRT